MFQKVKYACPSRNTVDMAHVLKYWTTRPFNTVRLEVLKTANHYIYCSCFSACKKINVFPFLKVVTKRRMYNIGFMLLVFYCTNKPVIIHNPYVHATPG